MFDDALHAEGVIRHCDSSGSSGLVKQHRAVLLRLRTKGIVEESVCEMFPVDLGTAIEISVPRLNNRVECSEL